jgi:L-alanine-DL-glutamate epimerase-like enolase superfamily enzyme
VDNWGLNGEQAPYEDLNAFLTDAGSLARDLLSEGINGMKIWPFDLCAERNRGMYLSDDELAECLRPLDSIRAAVGNEMGIAIELHSLWDLPTARRILRALTPYGLLWVEDPLRADNPDALAALARDSHVPIAVGETLAGPTAFRALFELDAVSMPIVDISWVGGITEARKIALLADSYRLPIAAHDCTGPVVLTASCHLSLHAPNALIQESVRSYYRGWYGDLVTALPIVADGHIAPPPGPGLGLELKSDLRSRPGVLTRSSRANTSAAAEATAHI